MPAIPVTVAAADGTPGAAWGIADPELLRLYGEADVNAGGLRQLPARRVRGGRMNVLVDMNLSPDWVPALAAHGITARH